MNRLLALLLSCLALGLVAGCGGDDEDSGGGAAAETTEQPADTGGGGADAGGVDAVKVSMKGIAFNSADVTVKKGGKVTWTNDEDVSHDVTKEKGSGPDFSSGGAGEMKLGDTFEQTFETAGKIDYVCTIHTNMTGTITVE